MYAIVDIAGQQFKVEKGKKIFVHLLNENEGNNVDFDKVLLIDNDGKISIGEPHIEGAFIEARVLEHTKGDKVLVFKKKRRKGYRVKKGHRQQFSQVEILSINETGFKKKDVAKKPAARTGEVSDSPAAKEALAEKETRATAARKAGTAKPAEAKASTEKKTAEKETATEKKSAAEKKSATEKKAPTAKKTASAKTTGSAGKAAAAKKTPAAAKKDTEKTAGKKSPAAKKPASAEKKGTAKPKKAAGKKTGTAKKDDKK